MISSERLAHKIKHLTPGAPWINDLPIIFLDVDGVLNYAGCPSKCPPKNEVRGVEPMLVERLRRILDLTGAVVVLSSTWRKHPDMLPHLWESIGKRYYPRWIGCTTEMESSFDHQRSRTAQIIGWIDAYTAGLIAPLRFCVIDDFEMQNPLLRAKQVLTSDMVGLEAHHVERAVRLLVPDLTINEMDAACGKI
jgi:hypothetical protein